MNQLKLRRRYCAAIAALLPILLATPSSGAVAAAPVDAHGLPVIALRAGGDEIRAEVARTTPERTHGLMRREHLDASDGMLFVFGDPQVQCFWMHDTLIPLSAAFIADDGRIDGIVDMAPRTDASHCSSRPVRFVLEMNQSWFARRGIVAGAFITGEPFTR